MSRAAISVERVDFNPYKNTLTVHERQDSSPSSMATTYTIMEFMALLAGHTPSPYESLVYYYGIYNSSYRGTEKILRKSLRLRRLKLLVKLAPHGPG